MILSLVALIGVDASSISSKAPGDCYWAVGETGDFLECLPEFYIKGGCESGSRSDCKLSKNFFMSEFFLIFAFKVESWEVADLESNVAQSIDLLTLETVIKNRVTGTVVRPGKISPVLMRRLPLDDVQHLPETKLVVIVGILVTRHNAVPRTLV